MTKCKCGGKVIFENGYVKASIKVSTYRCISCNTLYEVIENCDNVFKEFEIYKK